MGCFSAALLPSEGSYNSSASRFRHLQGVYKPVFLEGEGVRVSPKSVSQLVRGNLLAYSEEQRSRNRESGTQCLPNLNKPLLVPAYF